MTKEFQDQVAIITGGAGGIGLATAKQFLDQGAKVALVDLDEGNLSQAKSELASDKVITIAADVSKEADVENYVKETVDAFGRIDIFVNNAGINGNVEELTDLTQKNLESVIAVNVFGVFYGMKHVLKVMKEQKSGAIVNVASIGGWTGSPGMSPYVASKHAVVGATKSAALEVVGDNIRVNSVAPTAVDTAMMERIDTNRGDAEASRKATEEAIPMKRYAKVEEIADLIVYLSSDKASFITGSMVKIDGGNAALSN